MPHYTRPDRTENPFNTGQMVAPALLYQKWQAWDDLTAKKLERTKCRADYLRGVADAVHGIYNNNRSKGYKPWYERYCAALDALGSQSISSTSVWRLIVGWGTNPTLETGLTLHPLYGFPYIPGSALKGLLHHVAEMETMAQWPSDLLKHALPESFPPELNTFLQRLNEIRLLFGSIHLERARSKDGRDYYGELTPREALQQLQDHIATQSAEIKEAWKPITAWINTFLKENIGGMLRFYDAVPEPGQGTLLQVDIVNTHYGQYYKEGPTYPPSDDQQPTPITFLAVQPGVKFQFWWRLESVVAASPRDEQETERHQFLHNLSDDRIAQMVTGWLSRGLGLCGIGAKTAAGYGYFETEAFQKLQAEGNAERKGSEPTHGDEDLSTITPAEPKHIKSSISPGAKLSGITQRHGQNVWKLIAKSAYIARIEGGNLSTRKPEGNVPSVKISSNNCKLEILYQNERFYCPATVTLQGISNMAEALWVWENHILPELDKLEKV